jgi:hypothetical protein
MKRVLVHQGPLSDKALFNPNARDYSNDPYIVLRERLAERGYELTVSEDQPVRGAEWVLFFDAPSVYRQRLRDYIAGRFAHVDVSLRSRDVYRECLKEGILDKCALFLWEAHVFEPRNWQPDLHSRFKTIFTWHDSYVDGKQFHKIVIPQPSRFGARQSVDFRDKKLLVNISANKYSSTRGELYSARRAAIRYFERHYPAEFDLYGVGWHKPTSPRARLALLFDAKYPSYRGTIPNKSEVFPRYRFALTYENVQGVPGYVTEKIFDCMRSACVPVYLGAPNIADYVPCEVFVDRRNFTSNAELGSYLASMSEEEYSRYRAAAQEYLEGPRFAQFLEQAFADTVCHVLGLN